MFNKKILLFLSQYMGGDVAYWPVPLKNAMQTISVSNEVILDHAMYIQSIHTVSGNANKNYCYLYLPNETSPYASIMKDDNESGSALIELIMPAGTKISRAGVGGSASFTACELKWYKVPELIYGGGAE